MNLRRFAPLLSLLATLAPAVGDAAPQTMTLTGTATMEIHERIVWGDPYSLETSVVEATFDVTGIPTDGYNAVAVGTATLVEGDRSTVVYVQGSMHPPLGSGGEAQLGGVDEDGNVYCFGIYDYADAPSPRPDRTIAAFRVAEDYIANPGTLAPPWDLCLDLYYKHASVLDGDFSIAFSD